MVIEPTGSSGHASCRMSLSGKMRGATVQAKKTLRHALFPVSGASLLNRKIIFTVEEKGQHNQISRIIRSEKCKKKKEMRKKNSIL